MTQGGSYKYESIDLNNIPFPGSRTYEFGSTLYEHFSILAQTIVGFIATIDATNDDLTWSNVTDDLFGIVSLTAGNYIADTEMPFKNLRLNLIATGPVNKFTGQFFIKKGGGR